jgi:hypothetical protein
MDWTYPSGAGPEGIHEMGRRLAESVGRIPDVTTFIDDPRGMLRVTRRIERMARAGRLLVGFQKAAKLDAEAGRYRDLVAAGTRVTAFANGRPMTSIDGLEYRELGPARLPLANQWFLVSDMPEPIAFISWEVSDPRLFGMGGAATSGKRFVGLVSDDPDIVASLVAELESIGPTGDATLLARVARDPTPDRLRHAAEAAITPELVAPPGSVIVAAGRDDDEDALVLALAIARAGRRALVIIDRSAERIYGNPYSDLRGPASTRPRPDRLFDASIARREGRTSTATAIEAASAMGVEAGGWFPTLSGGAGLSEAARRFDGAVLVVPASVRDPSVGERARGMSVPDLQRLGLPIVIADRDGPGRDARVSGHLA